MAGSSLLTPHSKSVKPPKATYFSQWNWSPQEPSAFCVFLRYATPFLTIVSSFSWCSLERPPMTFLATGGIGGGGSSTPPLFDAFESPFLTTFAFGSPEKHQ